MTKQEKKRSPGRPPVLIDVRRQLVDLEKTQRDIVARYRKETGESFAAAVRSIIEAYSQRKNSR